MATAPLHLHSHNSCLVVWFTLAMESEVIYQTGDTVFHHISNTEKRVENTTRSRVFLTNFQVFDILMKHCDECLI